MAKIAGCKNIVIFDIDGVLADNSARLKYIQSKKKNYDAFYGCEMANDKPKPLSVRLLKLLKSFDDGYIVLLTGRPERTRELTKMWLEHYEIPYDELLMRKDGDHSISPQMKHETLSGWLIDNKISKDKQILLFDDDPNNTIRLAHTLRDSDYNNSEVFIVGDARVAEEMDKLVKEGS